ncbi:unnamed protein product [Musa hybrid cultivar]
MAYEHEQGGLGVLHPASFIRVARVSEFNPPPQPPLFARQSPNPSSSRPTQLTCFGSCRFVSPVTDDAIGCKMLEIVFLHIRFFFLSLISRIKRLASLVQPIPRPFYVTGSFWWSDVQ